MVSEAPVVFEQNIEGLLVAIKPELTPTLRAKLAAAGLDISRKLDPAYPADKLTEWLKIIVPHIFPTVDGEEGLRQMGRRFVGGWQSTLVGKATAALLKVIGPAAALRRMTRNFRTANNFTEVTVVEHGPGNTVLTFNDVQGIASYFHGIIEAGSELTAARNVKVTNEHGAPPGAVYRVTWDTR